MTSIPIGPSISIVANEIYALPSVPCTISSTAQVQTSILQAGPFANVSNGLINGMFIKSTVNCVVTLTKYIIEE